jgi:DNA-binding transcriptional LysR family regulator
MRLRHIEVFHAVMQTGSVSKAAELLGISQPAASKVLGHAESALGFRLFERIKGRLRPTAEAAILFVEAEKIQQGMGQVRSLAENLQRRPEGRLHIGCLPSLALSITPRAVKAFRRLHPTLTCQLETGHIDGLVRALRARRIDLALTFAPREHAGIRMQLLGEVELVYLGPNPGPGEFDLATLDPGELVRIADSDIVGRTVSEALAAVGVAGASTISSETYFAACALAAEVAGVAIVDELTAAAMARPGQHLRRIRPRMTVGVGVLTHDNEVIRGYYAAFVKILKDVFERSVAPHRGQPARV